MSRRCATRCSGAVGDLERSIRDWTPRRAADRKQLGVVVPGTAAGDVGILLGVRQDDRAQRRLVGGKLLVSVGDVMVEAPLGDVAVDVVRAPTGWASSCRSASAFRRYSTYQAYSSILSGSSPQK